MDFSAPTFISLNKSQKRALILRDTLRFLDPQHLNDFLEGISNDEPPTYTKVNGVTKPDLIMVTLKEAATRFDLGNVLLPEENNSIYRVYLVVENGQIQMLTEDPLPQDENVLDSQPIHGFIARTMVPMFQEKFQVLYARMNKINEARRAAYNMPNHAPVLFHEGETLARLDPGKAEKDRTATHTRKPRKRGPNEDVIQHVSNKRKRNGLATISEDAKSKTFDAIPTHVKVDLFNSIVKTAFPNFDNLMIAAWNVVTIYTACGSDFPDLHKAIVDLKGVLQDYDESVGQRVDRATPKYRHDFGGPSRDGANGDGDQDRNRMQDPDRDQDREDDGVDPNGSLFGTPMPTLEHNGASDAAHLGDTNADEPAQLQDDTGEQTGDMEKSEMPLSRPLQSSPPHPESDGDDDEDDQVPAVDPHLARTLEDHSTVRQSASHYMAETHTGGSIPISADSSPGQQYTRVPREHGKKVQEHDVDNSDHEDRALITLQHTSPGLARRREESASSIDKKGHEEPPLGKDSTTSTTQNAAATMVASVDKTDSYSERDQQTPQLHDHSTPTSSTTPTPKSRNKKQRDSSEYSVTQLEKKYQERKSHVLGTFGNDMSKVPERNRNALRKMEDFIEERKKEEAQKKAGKKSGTPGESGRSGFNNGGMFGNYAGIPTSNYLGKSVLGAKKPTGVAPVAPMFPNGNRKDPRSGVAQGRTGSTPPYGRRH